MFTVIKLGGVNGSGKTTVARAVMERLDNIQMQRVLLPSNKWTTVYFGRYEGTLVTILGKYDTACGGMDTISDKDDRLWLLSVYCKPKYDGLIFYEGLITGKTYGAMGELSEKHVKSGKGAWLYAFMDTPYDVCVERVLHRRQAAGNNNPFDPDRTMDPTYRSCVALESRLKQEFLSRAGPVYPHPTYRINHKHKPAKSAELLLAKALEMHNAR